jgi:hypothetical protein
MNYEEETAKEAPQKNHKLLQNLLQIPTEAVAVTAIAGLTAAGIIPLGAAIAIIVIGIGVLYSVNGRHEKEQAKGRASSYVNCNGPVLIYSTSPDEGLRPLNKRAEAWRQKLIESGNPYAHIIPIVIYEYKPILTQVGSLTMSWSMFQVSVGQKQYEENLSWYNGKCPDVLKAQFASEVLPAPKQADSLDD